MHDIAGLVALAAIGLWIAYLVPHRLRYRQQLLESRTEDRFSGALRVLVVADSGRRRGRAVEARTECGPDSAKRSGLLSPARGVPVGARSVTKERGGVVERPYGTQDKISADDARRAAQQRARRAAAVSRRAAAARRRAALTGVLLVASVLAWVVVGLTPVAVAVAVVPTVLLAGIVLLGRRAVVSARRADEAWERQQLERATRPAAPRAPRVTGRALHPSDSHTEAIAQVDADTAAAARAGSHPEVVEASSGTTAGAADAADDAPGEGSAERAGTTVAADAPAAATDVDVSVVPVPAGAVAPEAADDGWSPVPVPRPTYTTKATAPRREPLPLVIDDAVVAEADTVAATAGPADDATPVSSPVDLDAILARRRAAGE